MADEKVFLSVKDSGAREDFATGSVRDSESGKGCPSLIPWEYVWNIFEDIRFNNNISLNRDCVLTEIGRCFCKLASFERIDVEKINNVLVCMTEYVAMLIYLENNNDKEVVGHKWKIPAFRRLAVHYQNGAVKYSKNNWRKGQPVSRYVNSLIRHYWATIEGNIEEDHLAAMLWNIVAIYVMIQEVCNGTLPKEIYDYPFESCDWSK